MSWAITAMVAAAALTAYNQKETARKQDRAISQGILQRMQSTRDQSSAMQKALASLRASNDSGEVQQAKGDYLKALRTAGPMSSQPAQAGAMSDAYREAAGAASADSAGKATATAGLLAQTDAPAAQRQRESVLLGRLSSELAGANIAANDATNQAALKARGITPNPWIGLAAAALQGYGSGRMASAGTTTSASVQSPSSTGYFQGGGFSGGGNYTGPQSTSTDYMSNVRNLYGMGG